MLAPLLSHHPLSVAFAKRITDGAEFPLTDISDADRLADVTATLARGNLKSDRGHEAKLFEMLKDKEKRWQRSSCPTVRWSRWGWCRRRP